MTDLPHSLSRTVTIRAPRDVVFRYFTDSQRFAAWWGEGSTIEGRVGGAMRIRYPNDVVAAGEVVEIEPDRRVVFTYGYENAHPELPAGSSRVTVELEDHPEGTKLSFVHELPEEKMRDHHVPGWRYHLAVFANVAANEQHAGVGAAIDDWFAAWAETDGDARRALLTRCTTDDVSMRDAFSCLVGRDELHGHIHNSQVHMPGMTMKRDGGPRHCQGTALVGWRVDGPDGEPMMQGTNYVQLAPDGRIAAMIGFPG